MKSPGYFKARKKSKSFVFYHLLVLLKLTKAYSIKDTVTERRMFNELQLQGNLMRD